MLLERVEYKVEETRLGVWRSFASEHGAYFREFVSHRRLWGLPVLHYTQGICPETGGRRCAKGIVAIGRKAIGVLAIGQLAMGVVAIGQLGIGVLFGLGQGTTGIVAIGQAALGLAFGLGQFATGFIAIGQMAAGSYVFAYRGVGRHVWDMLRSDPEAQGFFKSFINGA